MLYAPKKMKRKGMTATPVAAFPVILKEPESPVMVIYAASMIDDEMRRSFLLPSLSTEKAAQAEQMRLESDRQAEIKVRWVTDVIPTVFSTIAR